MSGGVRRSLVACILTIVLLSMLSSWLYLTCKSLMAQIDRLENERDELRDEVNRLRDQITELQSRVRDLQREVTELRAQVSLLTQYFLVGDPNFTDDLVNNIWWGAERWNHDGDDYVKIEEGLLRLFYNETLGRYGNSGVFQGRHTDGRYTHQLWVRSSSVRDDFSDYVVFPKDIPEGKFWLEVRFRIVRMGFNCYPNETLLGFQHTPYARVNLGITLMCAIDNGEFALDAQTLWLDIFAGFHLNETHSWSIKENENYTFENPKTHDIHAGYWVSEISPDTQLGEWITLKIDLGAYVGKTLRNIYQIDVETVRVYGFILFVESIGAYAEVEYDYFETYVL
jgi:cell division protein FtsB